MPFFFKFLGQGPPSDILDRQSLDLVAFVRVCPSVCACQRVYGDSRSARLQGFQQQCVSRACSRGVLRLTRLSPSAPPRHRLKIRTNVWLPRTWLVPPLRALFPHATPAIPAPLLPRTVFLHVAAVRSVRPRDDEPETADEAAARDGVGVRSGVGVSTLEPVGVWRCVDEGTVREGKVVDVVGFLLVSW
jgi:hypothetical protein